MKSTSLLISVPASEIWAALKCRAVLGATRRIMARRGLKGTASSRSLKQRSRTFDAEAIAVKQAEMANLSVCPGTLI